MLPWDLQLPQFPQPAALLVGRSPLKEEYSTDACDDISAPLVWTPSIKALDRLTVDFRRIVRFSPFILCIQSCRLVQLLDVKAFRMFLVLRLKFVIELSSGCSSTFRECSFVVMRDAEMTCDGRGNFVHETCLKERSRYIIAGMNEADSIHPV
jgi:hypothetical protein